MPDRQAVTHVDPLAPHGPFHRAFLRFLGTRTARRLFTTKMMWRTDVRLMRLTGGRLGMGLLLPTGVLETRGARSGLTRRNVVIYFHDGEEVVIVASHAGAPAHPAWYHNARSHPDVLFNGCPFRAEAAAEDDLPRLWSLADQVFPVYATYREEASTAGRDIPVLRLLPS
ncbi:nitroreductase/quinone reductase family protein [Actinocorallia longicatena]|uniref:Deazaflavin-dependent oxidoreductase (Nitroreductase family) n=1 Tax=Actinocorallia longicatena TaxID=111803 RepID=A0ABP6PVZ1_9ACTN